MHFMTQTNHLNCCLSCSIHSMKSVKFRVTEKSLHKWNSYSSWHVIMEAGF